MDANVHVGNDNQSSVEGNNQKESNPSDDKKSKGIGSQKPNRNPLDWREFRASLYIQEQVMFLFPIEYITA